jgi:acetoin utilization deacetylase AcuC-like enzyme
VTLPFRRVRRRLLRALGVPGRGRGVYLIYHRRYRAGLAAVPMDAMRGERILTHLLEEGWTDRGRVVEPRPASLENLGRVHTREYLRSLDDPEVVGRIFGVTLTRREAEGAVELQRLAAGGTIQASRLALRRRAPQLHLGGGFHHAGPDRGTGFCALNDVAVAIARLRARGWEGRVLVVDLDLHDGNGTRRIFADDPTVHTFSIHNETWDEVEAVADTCIPVGEGIEDGPYLEVLRRELPPVVAAHRPELTFYLAGADVAEDDTYGDGAMTPDGILARDRFVAEELARRTGRLPMVVLLAGGYGGTGWRPPARFAAWLLSGRDHPLPDELSVSLDRVRWLEEPAGSAGKGGGDGDLWSFGPEDLAALGAGEGRGGVLLLGRYGTSRIRDDLERFGVLSQVRARGYPEPTVELQPSSGLGPTVRLFGSKERDDLLMELRLGKEGGWVQGFTLLTIEWLLLQDPRARFSPARPPLPDQRHPGLGVLADVVAWLVTLCRDAGLDGLAFRSSHFHVATLARRHLRFLRPEDEARFRAIADATRGLSLSEVAGAVAEGWIRDEETGEPVRWVDVPMVVPTSPDLKARMAQWVPGGGTERSPETPLRYTVAE